jgi:AraC-like DNA-binding protein
MKDNNISAQVVRYVMTIPDEEFAGLSVSKLAELFEIDRFKLSRQFKKQTRMTLDSFLTREKMSRAAFLLLSKKDITVKDVSRLIGFCTSDYFTRVFRDYYGIEPARYKEYKTRQPGSDKPNRKTKVRRKRQQENDKALRRE